MILDFKDLYVPKTASPLSDVASRMLALTVSDSFSRVQSDLTHEWVSHKHKHTIGVLHAFRRIVENSSLSLSDEQFDRAEAACLLHDLGRFYEHDGIKVYPAWKFQHGFCGAKIVQNSWLFPMSVALAVKWHDTKDSSEMFSDELWIGLSPAERDESVLLLWLVRDADKFENMEYKFSHFGSSRMHKVGGNNSDTPWYSPDAINAFGDASFQGTLPLALVKTVSDKKLSMVSWLSDFCFKESVSAFSDGLFGKMRASLMESARTDDERRLIEAGFEKHSYIAVGLTSKA